MLRAQQTVPKVWPPALHGVVGTMRWRRLVDWAFDHYLAIAPPDFVEPAPSPAARPASPRRSRAARRAAPERPSAARVAPDRAVAEGVHEQPVVFPRLRAVAAPKSAR